MEMNFELLRKKHEVFLYKLKPGTSSSFYLNEGSKNVLPERIGFSKNGFAQIQMKGRALIENKVGQFVGSFKRNEISPYKQNKPYKLFSSIWEAKDFPCLLGYGDIGISNNSGRIASSKDLFVIYASGKDSLEIHLFRGLVQFKESVLNYLNDFKKSKP